MGKLFTSESVTEGHPDKIADQISDAILDALIEQDPYSRVAAETTVATGLALIVGEITTKAYVDIAKVARDTIREIGYTKNAVVLMQILLQCLPRLMNSRRILHWEWIKLMSQNRKTAVSIMEPEPETRELFLVMQRMRLRNIFRLRFHLRIG